MMSYGEKPFRTLLNNEVVAAVERGLRPARPSGCPDDIWKIMIDCWHLDSERRPTFAYLESLLKRCMSSRTLSATESSEASRVRMLMSTYDDVDVKRTDAVRRKIASVARAMAVAGAQSEADESMLLAQQSLDRLPLPMQQFLNTFSESPRPRSSKASSAASSRFDDAQPTPPLPTGPANVDDDELPPLPSTAPPASDSADTPTNLSSMQQDMHDLCFEVTQRVGKLCDCVDQPIVPNDAIRESTRDVAIALRGLLGEADAIKCLPGLRPNVVHDIGLSVRQLMEHMNELATMATNACSTSDAESRMEYTQQMAIAALEIASAVRTFFGTIRSA